MQVSVYLVKENRYLGIIDLLAQNEWQVMEKFGLNHLLDVSCLEIVDWGVPLENNLEELFYFKRFIHANPVCGDMELVKYLMTKKGWQLSHFLKQDIRFVTANPDDIVVTEHGVYHVPQI